MGVAAFELDLLTRMRLVAPAGPLRSNGRGVPEDYEAGSSDGRPVTEVAAARGHPAGGHVLLAAAARYATTVSVRQAERPPTGAGPEATPTQEDSTS